MGNDTFAAAVGAIVESHKKLYALLLAAFESHKSGALPPRAKRVSRILDCEANGAHTILENLASAAKAAPRGSLGAQPDLLIAECRDFLDFLEDNLPTPDCAAAINDIRQTEESFINLIKGLSGCDPNITIDDYSRRIDKFVYDLKGLFRDLGHAVVKYEYELREREQSSDKNRSKKKSVKNIINDSVKNIRRKDSAAVKEIRRRVKLGESYAQAASYLKRNTAWNKRLVHLKTDTLIRYAKDKKR
jgi:hypothetical protein